MTWSHVGGTKTLSNKTSATSDTTASGFTSLGQAGDVHIVCIAIDNVGTTDGDLGDVVSVTDTKSNTYSKAKQQTNGQGAAAAGACAAIYWTKMWAAFTSTDTFTVNYNGSVAAKGFAGRIYRPTGDTITVDDSTSSVGDAADPAAVTLTPPSGNREYLWVAVIASEGPITDTFTNDADYTISDSPGTSGGGAASNMSCFSSRRIFTGSTDTYDAALTARDHAQVYVALKEDAAAATDETPQFNLPQPDRSPARMIPYNA